MAEKSTLPFKVDIHFSLGAENAGKVAVLYYYNELSGTMRFAGNYQITASGQAMFAVTRGDGYIVVVTERMPENLSAGSYTVVSGDTLTSIARKNGISLKSIIQANPQIANPNRIYSNQVITMP